MANHITYGMVDFKGYLVARVQQIAAALATDLPLRTEGWVALTQTYTDAVAKISSLTGLRLSSDTLGRSGLADSLDRNVATLIAAGVISSVLPDPTTGLPPVVITRPSFTTAPSISPGGGLVGATFTATDGTVSNGTVVSRRWLLGGVAIGTGATVVPVLAGTLILENTATGAGGTTISTSPGVVVARSGAEAIRPLGMNLSGPVAYYDRGFPFLDRIKASEWRAGAGSSGLSYDALGYPVALGGGLAQCLINVEGPLSGVAQTFVLECTNTTANFAENGGCTFTSNTVVNGKRRIVIDATNAILDTGYYINFTVDAPLSGNTLTCFRQDQEAALKAGGIFNPAWLARLAPFNSLRFMDFQLTNVDFTPNWATRPTPMSFAWKEVPLEIMVAACNQTGCHGWFNVHWGADDTFIQNTVSYIEANLRPDLIYALEYSNEVGWNYIFPQAGHSFAYNPPVDVSAAGYPSMSHQGYLAAHMASVAMKASGWSTRCRPVLMGQAGNDSTTQTFVDAANITIADWSNPSSPRYDVDLASKANQFGKVFARIGAATYFDGGLATPGMSANDKAKVEGWAAATDDSGLAAAFQQIKFGGLLEDNRYALANLPALYTGIAAMAQSLQVGLDAYEGGFAMQANYVWKNADGTAGTPVDPKQALVTDFFRRIMIDPRAEHIVATWAMKMRQVGFTTMNQFNDAGPLLNPGGTWAAMEDGYHPNVPKNLGLLDALAAPTALPAMQITTATNGGTVVGGAPTTAIIVTGGVGQPKVTVTGLAHGRTFDGFRSITGAFAQEETVDTVITATDEVGATTSITLHRTVAPAPVGFRYFRLTPLTNLGGDAPPAPYYRVGSDEVGMLDAQGAAIAHETGVWTAAYSGGNFEDANSPSHVVDNDPGSSWLTRSQDNAASGQIVIDVGSGGQLKPAALTVRSCGPVGSYSLGKFTVEVSNDKAAWTQIYAGASAPNYVNGVATIPLTYPS